jgi:hypothetical protein
LGGFDPEADREVGLAGPGRSEQDDVLGFREERPGGQVGDGLAFEAGLVVEDEVLDRPEPSCPGS